MSAAAPESPSLLAGTSRLKSRHLSRLHVVGIVVAAAAVTVLIFLTTSAQGVAGFVVVFALLALISVTVVAFVVEGRRDAVARFFQILVYSTFVIALLPLVIISGYTLVRGLTRFDIPFFTQTMSGVTARDPGGGAAMAIIGTVEQVFLATIMAVPVALLVAIYITEYGSGRLAGATRFVVDVMTGLPSIVAGLFVLSFWVIGLGFGYSGFATAMALTILMLPTVVRTAEEMILLVPRSLREASYALGVPKWKTILRIVLPTAATGITTGILLAIARVTGETAPVLLLAGGSNFVNWNPFSGPQSSLSLFAYNQATSSLQVAVDRAWTASLTLILIVTVLYVAARLVTRRNTLGK